MFQVDTLSIARSCRSPLHVSSTLILSGLNSHVGLRSRLKCFKSALDVVDGLRCPFDP